ncbi:hypothetical protein O0I10_004713 [Lichtheimia ornata]|uniref:Cut9 interacting protein n=1 Tax=Lichtheimia ornata TaxID=688661 RepID=A0AAD7V743_9FUNG|nr:uncharacterized protein O0I10_004713 [Lichtheimia ornata]KAJ8659731.1 hypothetical protein O0I10_004713 [Lichtheimia ornata]
MVLYEELCDAHCHPHDDADNRSMIPQLKTGHITLMGVRQDDWDTVAQVAKQCPNNKCIPAFGLHPWFLHRVMVDDKDKEAHYDAVLTSSNESEKSEMISALDPPFPRDEWYNNLKQHLEAHPEAIVGEVGLDRAARLLPGGAIEWHGVKPTSVQCTIEHQLQVLELQLQLAKELNRPMSVHCVQAQGHLLALLQKHAKNNPPIRLCLHSFGGSPGTLPQFMKLKGYTIYVSYSIAINERLGKKLDDLILAVPHDRLLIESDLNTPKGQDDAMVAIAERVAHVHNWTIDQAIKQTHENWCKFIGIR